MIQAAETHAVWLSNGQVVIGESSGPALAAALKKRLGQHAGHKVERFFAKEHYAVWLRQCP